MRYFIILSCFLFFVSIFSLAQDDDQKADTLKYELNQVTKTATRYPENIIEIPYAVSIIPGNKLKNSRGYGMDEVLSQVPGVLAQSRSGNQDIRITIRGFGARGAGDRSNSGTSRGIRILLDGITETEPDGRTAFDNIDLSFGGNIEVIRSNSSALWGNAGGGVINISSMPDFNSSFVNLGGMGGSFGFQKYVLQTGAMLGDGKIAGSFSTSIFDGWRDHSSSKRTILNVAINSMVGEKTNLGVYMVGTSNLFHIPGPLTLDQFNSDPKQSNPTYKSRDERRYNRLGRVGITLDHSVNEMHNFSGMVYVNPKYLQRSERGTFRDFTRYHFGGNIMYRNSAKFSESVSNKLIVGMDEAYQDGAILFYSLSPTNGRGDELRDNKREGANNFGAFAQTEVMINKKVSFIVGGRYDDVTYYSQSFIETSYGLQKKSFERFTPKAGITYLFSPTHSIYANLGGGVEVPAGNETDPAGTYGLDSIYLLNPLLEPITSTTIETGTKQLLYIGRNSFIQSLSYDLAAYYIIINNDIIPYRGGRFYFTAGETNRYGIELGTNLEMNNGFAIDLALTYSQNKYKDYLVDSAHYGVPEKFADYKDNKVAGIPDIYYNISLTYAPAMLNGLFVNLSLNGCGEYFVDDANTIIVPSYNVLNATLGLNKELQLGEHLTLRGFVSVNNLTDEKYAASAFINPDFVNGVPVYLEPGLPRNVTASLSLGFN
jgi:iron complex outermembrane recepter protein